MSDPLREMAVDLADIINYELDEAYCTVDEAGSILSAFLDAFGKVVTDYDALDTQLAQARNAKDLLTERIQRDVALRAKDYVHVVEDPQHPETSSLRKVYTGSLIVLTPGGTK